MGRCYNFDFWKENKLFGMSTLWKHIDVYKVEDINEAEKQLWIVITESSWLLLEKTESGMVLKVWATLYTLTEVKVNPEVPHNLHFEWTNPDKSETFELEYYIEEIENCIKSITGKMKKLGIKVIHNGINEEIEEIKNGEISIENIIIKINESENRLGDSLKSDEVQNLLSLYQKASNHNNIGY